jgi:hypothetical protein
LAPAHPIFSRAKNASIAVILKAKKTKKCSHRDDDDDDDDDVVDFCPF